ncbi:MAG: hypothetical protein MK086_10185 [Flavobacteriales bacterium]|nr:hypothetical protein [Flavobacteriales bacterium]
MSKLGLCALIILFSFKGSVLSQSRNNENLSTVILELNYKSPGLRGMGGYLSLKNLNSGEEFQSESNKLSFNSFVIVENLPPGTYEVIDFNLEYGGGSIGTKNSKFFNHLNIKPSSNYFVGSYLAKKVKPIFKFHIQIFKVSSPTEEKILKKLNKKSDRWSELNLDFTEQLLRTDTSLVIVRD